MRISSEEKAIEAIDTVLNSIGYDNMINEKIMNDEKCPDVMRHFIDTTIDQHELYKDVLLALREFLNRGYQNSASSVPAPGAGAGGPARHFNGHFVDFTDYTSPQEFNTLFQDMDLEIGSDKDLIRREYNGRVAIAISPNLAERIHKYQVHLEELIEHTHRSVISCQFSYEVKDFVDSAQREIAYILSVSDEDARSLFELFMSAYLAAD